MKLAIGDRVAYSAAFLRNTGQQTGEAPFVRGIVTALKEYGGGSMILATVEWNDPEWPPKCATSNLAKVGSREFAAD
jgi:hypothetical protein